MASYASVPAVSVDDLSSIEPIFSMSVDDDKPTGSRRRISLSVCGVALLGLAALGASYAASRASSAGDSETLTEWALNTGPSSSAAASSASAAASSSSSSSKHSGKTSKTASSAAATSTSRGLMLSTEYERISQREIGDGLYPHPHIAQVQKETRLELASGEAVYWRVTEEEDAAVVYESVDAEGWCECAFAQIGTYSVSAYASKRSLDADEPALASFSVSSRVVRREIRSLSGRDRERFLSAMHTLYSTPQQEGVRLYGSSFKSADWLIREHMYGAAGLECDHWHDDAGIMNHHVGVTWQMEASMRLVDDSTGMHYWDYTEDAATLGTAWASSSIFEDDWFGAASPRNAHRILDSGRWAFTKVLSGDAATAFSNLTNPYGLLRSPWNTNKTPYLLRSNRTLGSNADRYLTFPYCSSFAQYLQESTWIGEMLFAINGALHGPVHIMIGGHWNYDYEKWANVTEKLSFPDAFLLLSKFLWRQGYLRCPETCSTDTAQEDCMCSCPAELTGVGLSRTAEEFVEFSGLNALSPNSDLVSLYIAQGLTAKDYLKMLCHVGHPGEMFTSAAPQDPTFWPLHGNGERYLQYARLLNAQGNLSFSEEWGYAHKNALPSDTGIVCDWTAVHGTNNLPVCVKDICPGHQEDDLLPFADLMTNQTGLYSNKEFYNLTTPTNQDLPYVYDSLSYWPGCTDDSLLSYSGQSDGPAPPGYSR